MEVYKRLDLIKADSKLLGEKNKFYLLLAGFIFLAGLVIFLLFFAQKPKISTVSDNTSPSNLSPFPFDRPDLVISDPNLKSISNSFLNLEKRINAPFDFDQKFSAPNFDLKIKF